MFFLKNDCGIKSHEQNVRQAIRFSLFPSKNKTKIKTRIVQARRISKVSVFSIIFLLLQDFTGSKRGDLGLLSKFHCNQVHVKYL